MNSNAEYLYTRKCGLKSPAACEHLCVITTRFYNEKGTGPKMIKVCTLRSARYTLLSGEKECSSIGGFVVVKRPGRLTKEYDKSFVTVCGLKSPATCEQIRLIDVSKTKKVDQASQFYRLPICGIRCANKNDCLYFGKSVKIDI